MPDPAPEAVAILEKVMHVNGKPLNEPQTLAWHPLFLRRFALFAGFFLTQLMIPDRDKEILMMRTIHHARCEYLFGHHRITAREAGMSEEEIARITESATVGWSTRDALLIGIADEVWQNSDLSDKSWAGLSGVYDEARLLEVVMLVCFIAGFVHSSTPCKSNASRAFLAGLVKARHFRRLGR